MDTSVLQDEGNCLEELTSTMAERSTIRSDCLCVENIFCLTVEGSFTFRGSVLFMGTMLKTFGHQKVCMT